jgi:hypothetical protein
VEIAPFVRKQTTVSLRWLARELVKDGAMNVSRLTAPALK